MSTSQIFTSQQALLLVIYPSDNLSLLSSNMTRVCVDIDPSDYCMISSDGVYSNEEYNMAVKYKTLN
jgi:hypothetical protein